MDYPFAFAVALPSSTFIITIGVLVGKAMNKNKSNNPSITRPILDGILNKKFEGVVYADRCKAIVEGIKSEMKLTRETLAKGIEDIKREIRSNK